MFAYGFSFSSIHVVLGLDNFMFKEKGGIYYVRSAYKLLQVMKGSNVAYSISMSSNERMSLRGKHVATEEVCPLCGIFAETDMHYLLKSRFFGGVWEATGFVTAGWNFSSISSWSKAISHGLDLNRELWLKSISNIKVNVNATLLERDLKFRYTFGVQDTYGSLVVVRASCYLGKVVPMWLRRLGSKKI
uniref:Uncharacterized protein n=1 Tax=Cannabis sativa TaxID=3483 RepID=A0A803QGD7_CANSA